MRRLMILLGTLAALAAGSALADTLAVIPTHLGGVVANLEPVLEIAERAGACVLEDAAQALGATWHGRPVGTVGEIGCYSLSRGKGLTLYEGGCCVARDDELRAAIARTGTGHPDATLTQPVTSLSSRATRAPAASSTWR